jgi:hypothetical protein
MIIANIINCNTVTCKADFKVIGISKRNRYSKKLLRLILAFIRIVIFNLYGGKMAVSAYRDIHGKIFIGSAALPKDAACCPCVVVANGTCRKLNDAEKVCYVICTAGTGGTIGALCGLPAGGLGAAPGFLIGLAVGTVIALAKLGADECDGIS